MDYDNSHHTHLNTIDLKEVVAFLKDQVIPALQNQPHPNLIETLGGKATLKSQIAEGPSYKNRFGISDTEDLAEETFQYIYIAERLKELIEKSIAIDIKYEISYDE